MDVSYLLAFFTSLVRQELQDDLMSVLHLDSLSWVIEFLCIRANMASTEKVLEVLTQRCVPSLTPGTWLSPGMVVGMLDITPNFRELSGKQDFQDFQLRTVCVC